MNQEKLYYSLLEAAENLNIKETDLLLYGSDRNFSIMVAVPEELKVIQHQKIRVPGHIPVITSEVPRPLFLALKPSYCVKVASTGETKQSEFPYGYYLADQKENNESVGYGLLRTYPEIVTDLVENPVHVWTTVGKPLGSHCWENYIFENNGASPDIGSPINIKLSNLFLPPSTLNLIREKLKESRQYSGELDTSSGTHGTPILPDDAKGKGDVSYSSLLKLVIGMSVDGYGYDCTAKKSTVPSDLERNLELIGINITNDTIRKALQIAAAKHPPSIKPK